MAILSLRAGALAIAFAATAPAFAQTPVPPVLATAVPATPQLPAANPSPAPPVAHAHRAIATAVPAAQAAFDRGLLMLYAFNVGEARLAFRAAEAADPRATLAYFGEAVAETIDINRPTTPDGETRGADAIARGRAAAAAAPGDEAELFAAAAQRYDLKRPQKQRFAAYFTALQAYADRHPADGMGLTLAAYAGWNATDALTTGPGNALIPDARTMAADLDAALALDPADVGAHHLRIHLWEQAYAPEHALPDAEYLAALAYAPGESHLPHMAGHIFDRLGDYARMIAANQTACANDAVYFAHGRGPGQQYMQTYHEHDVAFVLYGLTTIGRAADARTFAARESSYDRELVALRTHDNAGVLRQLGDAITPARVIAEARGGDLVSARKDLATLGSRDDDAELTIASAVVARAAHDDATAIADYRKALAAAGTSPGDPKLHWQTPIGEGLGAVLLEANEPAAAESVFRAELRRFPNDPRLEFGLAQALAAQGHDDAAERSAYRSHWQGERPLAAADLG